MAKIRMQARRKPSNRHWRPRPERVCDPREVAHLAQPALDHRQHHAVGVMSRHGSTQPMMS
jgi:hypothetical protein